MLKIKASVDPLATDMPLAFLTDMPSEYRCHPVFVPPHDRSLSRKNNVAVSIIQNMNTLEALEVWEMVENEPT